jgi:hypothetical protein
MKANLACLACQFALPVQRAPRRTGGNIWEDELRGRTREDEGGMRECGILEDYSSIRRALVDLPGPHSFVPFFLPPFRPPASSSLPNVVFRFLVFSCCLPLHSPLFTSHESSLPSSCAATTFDDAPPRSKPICLLVRCPLPLPPPPPPSSIFAGAHPHSFAAASQLRPTPLSLPPARNNKSNYPRSFLLHLLLRH